MQKITLHSPRDGVPNHCVGFVQTANLDQAKGQIGIRIRTRGLKPERFPALGVTLLRLADESICGAEVDVRSRIVRVGLRRQFQRLNLLVQSRG